MPRAAGEEGRKRALLLCHGKVSPCKLPWYINEREFSWISWDSDVTLLDDHPFAIPDVVADLTVPAGIKRASKKITAGSMDLILPIYCSFAVYGTWAHPNVPFLKAAAKWLKPGGILVISMAQWGIRDVDVAEKEGPNAGFIARLPFLLRIVAKKHGTWPIPSAIDEIKGDKARLAKLRAIVVGKFPSMATAFDWYVDRVTTIAVETLSRRTIRERMDHYAREVERLTGGALVRAPGSMERRLLTRRGDGEVIFVRS